MEVKSQIFCRVVLDESSTLKIKGLDDKQIDLEKQSREFYYTNFTDEILQTHERPGEYSVNDMQSYRKKVNKYLQDHKDDLVIYKLRHNKRERS